MYKRVNTLMTDRMSSSVLSGPLSAFPSFSFTCDLPTSQNVIRRRIRVEVVIKRLKIFTT